MIILTKIVLSDHNWWCFKININQDYFSADIKWSFFFVKVCWKYLSADVSRDYYIWKLEWPKHYGTYLWKLKYFGLWCESLWYLTSMQWCVCASYALVWNEIMVEPCWFFGLGSVKWNLLVVFCSGVGAFMQTLEEFVLAIFSAFVQFP